MMRLPLSCFFNSSLHTSFFIAASAPRPHTRDGWPVALSCNHHLTSSKLQYQVQRRIFLDVVVRQGSPRLELLPCKDEPLLVERDPFLPTNLGLQRDCSTIADGRVHHPVSWQLPKAPRRRGAKDVDVLVKGV